MARKTHIVKKYLARLCSVLMISLFLFAPARADYWDDVKAKAQQCGDAAIDQGSLALDVVGTGPRIAACASTLATSNAGGIAITGLVAGLYLAGKFDTEDQCQGLLVSLIAEQLAKLIEKVPTIKTAIKELVELLGGNGEDAINVFLNLAAGEAVDIMQDIEGAQVLFGYFGCACTVIGGSADLQKQMDKANDSKNECLGPIGDALAFFEGLNGEVLDFLVGLIPDVDVFASPNLGEHYYITPDAVACPLDHSWTGGLTPYTKAYAELVKGQLVLPDNNNAVFVDSGMCICPAGTLPSMEWNEDKTKIYASCGCPEGEKFDANFQCVNQCEYGKKYNYTDHACLSICKYGVFEGYSGPAGKTPICVTTCDDPKAVFDWTKGKCEVCGPKEQTIRTGIGEDDRGRCNYCGDDGKLTADNKCESICGDSWTQHKVNFAGYDVCEPKCGAGSRYVETTQQGDGGLQPFKCEPCGANTQLDPNTNTCVACASGATWIPASAVSGPQCQCASGLAPVNGVCMQCPGGVPPSTDGNGGLVCPSCAGGGDCHGSERIACYFNNGVYDTDLRICKECGDDEHVSKGECVKNERKITEVKDPKADRPCAEPNEVREALTLECVSCGDNMKAIGNRCWPIPQTDGLPKAPETLLARCEGENEVRDPYSLRCTTCGEAGFALNSQCLANGNALKVPSAKTVPKAKLVSLDPAQKSCPSGTYPLGEKYCQQDVLPQGQTAQGRCTPKGANMVFDGRVDGSCTPCTGGTKPNAGHTACIQTASLTPTSTPTGKAANPKTNPGLKGASVKPDVKPELKGTAVKPKKQELKGTALLPKQPEGTKSKSIAPDLDSDGPAFGSRPGAGSPAIPGGGFGGAAPGGNRKP